MCMYTLLYGLNLLRLVIPSEEGPLVALSCEIKAPQITLAAELATVPAEWVPIKHHCATPEVAH